MSSVIRKVKDALHSDTPKSHFGDVGEHVPGSFPKEGQGAGSEGLSNKLKDGAEYIAPSGTAVGAQGQGRSSVGRDGQGLTETEPRVDDRNLMDPADRSHGSNIMNTTGKDGDPVSGSDRVTSTSSGSHHNKLHKKEDPRGHDVGAGYPETEQLGQRDLPVTSHDPSRTGGSLRRQEGQDDLQDVDRHGQHLGAGTMAAGGLAGAGAGALGTKELTERHRHQPGTDSTARGYTDELPQTRDTQPTYGQGVYNTVTGAGSGEGAERIDHQRHAVPTDTRHPGTTSTTAGPTAGAVDQQRYGGPTGTYPAGSGPTATGPTAGAVDQQRYGGPIGTYPAGTGATAGTADQQRHAVPTESHHTGLAAAAGTTAGAATAAGAMHGHQSHGQQDLAQSEQWPLGHSGNTTDRVPERVPVGSDRILKETMRDHPPSTQPSSGLSQGRDPRDMSSGATGMTGSSATAAPIGSGGGSATTAAAAGASPDHYGPGHVGSKVLHKCTNCGHDNDISTYFKRDVTFRMG